MSVPAIEIRDLRVDYGDFVAVKDISLTIPQGVVHGLVGPNGAGKTSTFKVLTTLMRPTYGEVKVAGLDIFEETEAARRVMGYMPDLAPVSSDLKLGEFLSFYADSYRIGDRRQRQDRVAQSLESVNLTEKRNSWCHELSRGQTQRLILAKTLLHQPKVMILDEPASGLDPLSRRDLRLTLQSLAREGTTILVSSHILSELAEMCSSLCVMNQGEILANGTAEDVRQSFCQGERTLAVSTFGKILELTSWLERRDEVEQINVEDAKVNIRFDGSQEVQRTLLHAMITEGLPIRSFEEFNPSFEDILLDIAQENREA